MAITCVALSGPRLTVSRPIEDTVPSWLVVTTTAAPLPMAPGMALVTTTLAPDCAAVYSGEDIHALIALEICAATALGVDPGATTMGRPITATPPMVMLLIVPPLASMLVTAMLPSFGTAAHSEGVAAQLIVCVRPRCLA